MSAPGPRGLSDELRAGVDAVWQRLLAHPFVVEMAAGTLPEEKYLFYVEQNLLYLPEYARAIAWGAAKSPDNEALRAFAGSLTNILQVEIPHNERLRDRVRSSTPVRHPADVMAPDTLAYTSYLLATAAQGDALDVQTLLLPCAWSYGAIASGLIDAMADHPIYSEWFQFFASTDYALLVSTMREHFDLSAAEASGTSRARMARIFADATRLENAFWDMAYDTRQWSDLDASSPRQTASAQR
jgi:thiaminase (transcriptional activator TenA)